MKPFWPFYGSKWRDARRYGAPCGDFIIEPFAGSAGYSTFYAPRRVVLYDIDLYIVGVWQYLIGASRSEILALPDLGAGQSVDSLAIPQEARWLIGFWLNRGSAQPKKTRTAYSARTDRQQLVWSQRARERIAQEIENIRHWTIIEDSYENVPCDLTATYFIDPPYEDKGKHYRCKSVDLIKLGTWCKALPGCVIACEQVGATWLPFTPLASVKSSRGRSYEAVWTNEAAASRRL